MAMNKREEFAQAVATELTNEREKQEVGYRELSRRTGINTGTLHKYMTGARTLPISTLYEIAGALGVDAMTIAARAQKRME